MDGEAVRRRRTGQQQALLDIAKGILHDSRSDSKFLLHWRSKRLANGARPARRPRQRCERAADHLAGRRPVAPVRPDHRRLPASGESPRIGQHARSIAAQLAFVASGLAYAGAGVREQTRARGRRALAGVVFRLLKEMLESAPLSLLWESDAALAAARRAEGAGRAGVRARAFEVRRSRDGPHDFFSAGPCSNLGVVPRPPR